MCITASKVTVHNCSQEFLQKDTDTNVLRRISKIYRTAIFLAAVKIFQDDDWVLKPWNMTLHDIFPEKSLISNIKEMNMKAHLIGLHREISKSTASFKWVLRVYKCIRIIKLCCKPFLESQNYFNACETV